MRGYIYYNILLVYLLSLTILSPLKAFQNKKPPLFSRLTKNSSLSSVTNDSATISTSKVEAVLDTLRPLLEADGGNCILVNINRENVVFIQMQGACKDCPSSAMTVKLGIERRLKEEIPAVTRVEAVTLGATGGLNEEAIHKVLNSLKPFISVCGGQIGFVNLHLPKEGVASCLTLSISQSISVQIRAEIVNRIRVKFPLLKEIVFRDQK